MTLCGRNADAATLARRQDGQAMAEYAFILALVVAGLIAGYTALGTTCIRLLNDVVTAFTA